jgi:hypothetical protein
MSELGERRPHQVLALIGDGDVGGDNKRSPTGCRYLCRGVL